MRFLFYTLSFIYFFSHSANAEDFLIDTKHQRAGFLTGKTTFADIEKRNIPYRNELRGIGEGESCEVSTLLWPDKPQEIELYWHESEFTKEQEEICNKWLNSDYKNTPSPWPLLPSVRLSKVFVDREDSVWSVDNAVEIGTRLPDLEKLYGPIHFAGFGFDLGGNLLVDGSNHLPGNLYLRLSNYRMPEDEYAKLEGDRTFISSDLAEETKLKIGVAEMTFRFKNK